MAKSIVIIVVTALCLLWISIIFYLTMTMSFPRTWPQDKITAVKGLALLTVFCICALYGLFMSLISTGEKKK